MANAITEAGSKYGTRFKMCFIVENMEGMVQLKNLAESSGALDNPLFRMLFIRRIQLYVTVKEVLQESF